MKPDTPVLMIALQIPVLPETNVEEILEAIGRQLGTALEQIRRDGVPKPPADDEDPERVPQTEFNATILKEEQETFSDDTRDDLLATLGYSEPA